MRIGLSQDDLFLPLWTSQDTSTPKCLISASVSHVLGAVTPALEKIGSFGTKFLSSPCSPVCWEISHIYSLKFMSWKRAKETLQELPYRLGSSFPSLPPFSSFFLLPSFFSITFCLYSLSFLCFRPSFPCFSLPPSVLISLCLFPFPLPQSLLHAHSLCIN